MNKFLGLLKKEWVLYRLTWFVAIIAGLIFLYAAEYFTDIVEDRFLFASWVLMIGSFLVIFQFFTSIRNDLKTKEVWLHSSSSIAFLVGVKISFTLGCSIMFSLVFSSLGLYTSQQFNDATFMQTVFMQLLLIGIFVFVQLLTLVLLVLLLAFNIYLKRFLGRFAFVISMGVFFFSLKLWNLFFNSQYYQQIFHHGEISFKGLSSYLPPSNGSTFTVNLHSGYVVEDLASLLGLILLYIVATKWLEKAVLR